MESPRIRTALLIEEVLAGTLSASAAIEEVGRTAEEGGRDRLIETAFHLLIHYHDDEDIRSTDVRYSDAQRGGLEKLARRLRADVR